MNEYTCRGDTVQVFPGAGVVAVTTTTSFDVKQPRRITSKLPMQQVLPKL